MVSTSACHRNLVKFLENKMDTNYKGCITEMKIMTHFLELGYPVSQPLLQNSKYDCIIDVNGILYKIQIKTSRLDPKNDNVFIFNCKSVTTTGTQNITTKYSKKEIDFFATVWDNKYYLVPVEECSVEKRLWLTKPTHSKSCFAEDYEMEAILKTL